MESTVKYSGREKRKNYDVSVVAPLHNEEGNIAKHLEQIENALSQLNRSFEVIFVNDGSTDGSEEILTNLLSKNPNITVINLYRKNGKAAALEIGISMTKGNYIVIIDSDLQYDASDILPMIKELDNGYDLVSGNRVKRRDSVITSITSGIFNMIIRRITGLKFVDYFSGLKCFRRDVIKYLSLYGDLYRFAAVYAFRQRFKVKEIPIKHYHRSQGISKYSAIKRFNMALLDILTVLMTVTFNQDRVYYIGLFGLLALSIGAIFLLGFLLLYPEQVMALSLPAVRIGIGFIFFGIQAILLKKISNDFFFRHQSERLKRKSNLKNVLRHEVG